MRKIVKVDRDMKLDFGWQYEDLTTIACPFCGKLVKVYEGDHRIQVIGDCFHAERYFYKEDDLYIEFKK